MSDDNKENEKKSLRSVASDLSRKAGSAAIAPFRMVLKLVSKTIRLLLWNPITIGAVMFLIGARMHETGQLAGHFKKDLRGATVRLSGNCSVGGKVRLPALAEDQVKITYINGEKLQAVVRQTREIVECKLSEIALDTLPLLAYMGKDMKEIPELTMPVQAPKSTPDYKKLEKKTLIMSGSCVDFQDKVLPAFTDEKVDVTAVEGIKDSEDQFVLSGIKKTDQIAIKCLSSAIKYSEYIVTSKTDGMETNNLGGSQNKSYVGETLVITGTCFPDERTKVNKQKKYLFYKLANSKIQILEHDLSKDGKINRLIGTVLDQEFRGDAVYCDKAKFPFIYKEYDEDSMKLEKGAAAEAEGEATPAPVPTPAPVENNQ